MGKRADDALAMLTGGNSATVTWTRGWMDYPTTDYDIFAP